jgi:hypothetical protein
MVVSGRMCSSRRNSTSPLRVRMVTGATSASKAALVPRRLGPLLGLEGDAVGLLPGHLVAAGQLLGGLGHGQVAVGVGEGLPEQVLEVATGLPQPELAPAGAPDHVGRLAHGFGAAGQAASAWPSMISWAALTMAWKPLPHSRLMVMAGTSSGTPARSPTCRAR